ncbi:hypothetical protein GH714_015937 [Hevea brasiliensis]|uniref:Uncharacterized protein n=1 Tax=Hevea brasiliensis TaxID=3981 RepID=A0A6A6K6C3_HEVBR|nr:hypothetical protein GH714_015937 [Hevea brasiliensis]
MPATSSTSTLVISNGDASKKFVNVITQRQSRILKTATAVNLESDESPFTVAPKTIEEESPLSEFGNISAESFISSSKRRSRSAISWPEELKSDWTQLSMSTPMYEKIALSPSMLSREFDPNRMGLG